MLCIDCQITGGREVFIPHCERRGGRVLKASATNGYNKTVEHIGYSIPTVVELNGSRVLPKNQCTKHYFSQEGPYYS